MIPSRSHSRRRGRRRLVGYPHDEFPFRCFTMVPVPEGCELDAVILFRPLSSPGPADFRARVYGRGRHDQCGVCDYYYQGTTVE